METYLRRERASSAILLEVLAVSDLVAVLETHHGGEEVALALEIFQELRRHKQVRRSEGKPA